MLQPVVAEDDVAEFEARHGLTLPVEYRAFITQVGAGGAGPGYGLYSFDRSDLDDALDDLGWTTFLEPSSFYRTVHGHTVAWSLDFEGVDQELVKDAANEQMAGTWVLADYGCASWAYLVVAGEAAGEVWNADGLDNEPMEKTFADWYGLWLDWLIEAQLEPIRISAGTENLGIVDAWFARLISNELSQRDREHRFRFVNLVHTGAFEIGPIDEWDAPTRRAFIDTLDAMANDLAAASDPPDARLHASHTKVAAAELVRKAIDALA